MRGPKVRALECGSVTTAFANGGASAGQAYSARRRRQAAALQGGLRPQMSKLQGTTSVVPLELIHFRPATRLAQIFRSVT